jgi:hypothetical protein
MDESPNLTFSAESPKIMVDSATGIEVVGSALRSLENWTRCPLRRA